MKRQIKCPLIIPAAALLISLFSSCATAPPKPRDTYIRKPTPPPRVVKKRTPRSESTRLYRAARVAYAQGHYEKALSLLREIREISNPPRLAEAETKILQALYQRVKRDSAAGNYDSALAGIQLLEQYSRPPELKLAKGMIYFQKGDLEKAGRILFSRQYARHPEALALAGFIHFENGRKERAEKAWRRAFSLDNRLAGLGLSVISFERGEKNWARSFRKYREAYSDLPRRIRERSLLSRSVKKMRNRMVVFARILEKGKKHLDEGVYQQASFAFQEAHDLEGLSPEERNTAAFFNNLSQFFTHHSIDRLASAKRLWEKKETLEIEERFVRIMARQYYEEVKRLLATPGWARSIKIVSEDMQPDLRGYLDEHHKINLALLSIFFESIEKGDGACEEGPVNKGCLEKASYYYEQAEKSADRLSVEIKVRHIVHNRFNEIRRKRTGVADRVYQAMEAALRGRKWLEAEALLNEIFKGHIEYVDGEKKASLNALKRFFAVYHDGEKARKKGDYRIAALSYQSAQGKAQELPAELSGAGNLAEQGMKALKEAWVARGQEVFSRMRYEAARDHFEGLDRFSTPEEKNAYRETLSLAKRLVAMKSKIYRTFSDKARCDMATSIANVMAVENLFQGIEISGNIRHKNHMLYLNWFEFGDCAADLTEKKYAYNEAGKYAEGTDQREKIDRRIADLRSGEPPDRFSPVVFLTSPKETNSTTSAGSIAVRGVAYDDKEVKRVLVNGRESDRLIEAGTFFTRPDLAFTPGDSYHFQLSVPLSPGENVIRVEAVDSSWNRGTIPKPLVITQTLKPEPGEGLKIIVTYNDYPYLGGESILVDTGVVTLDIVRLELSEGTFDPRNGVVLQLKSLLMKETPVQKGLDGIDYDNLRPSYTSYTYKNVRVPGLEIGENRLVISMQDTKGGKHQAAIIIRRSELEYQKIAILMGVKEYPWDPGWSKEFVEGDLSSMKEVLERQGYSVKTVVNPTVVTMAAWLRRLRAASFSISTDEGKNLELGDKDDLVIYFTGHGYRINPDEENEYGLIVPFKAKYDETRDRPDEAESIAMDDFVHALKRSKARHKLLILDTCYAALAGVPKSPPAAPKNCDRKFIEQKGLYLMAASEKDEKSWANKKNIKQSAFTRRLVEALRGKARQGDEGCITYFDIAGYVNRHLEGQSPVFRFLSKDNGMPYFENLGE